MKTVRLLKDRGGDKAGGKVTLPDATANELVESGTASFDLGTPVLVPQVAASAPQSAAALADHQDLVRRHEDLEGKHAALRAAAEEQDRENAEFAAENKRLTDELKVAKAEIARLTAIVETDGKPGPVSAPETKPESGKKGGK